MIKLIKQLKPGGRMLIPVGEEGGDQTLLLVDKSAEGLIQATDLMNVSFPPLKDKERQLSA